LRGVGKTVLLNRVKSIGEDHQYKTLLVEAHEGKTLPELLVPGLQSALYSMSFIEGSKDTARKGLRILKSFLIWIEIGNLRSVFVYRGTAWVSRQWRFGV
jgi:hypothetical protein